MEGSEQSNFSYCHGVCVEGLRKTVKTSLRMARPELDIMWLLHKFSAQKL